MADVSTWLHIKSQLQTSTSSEFPVEPVVSVLRTYRLAVGFAYLFFCLLESNTADFFKNNFLLPEWHSGGTIK